MKLFYGWVIVAVALSFPPYPARVRAGLQTA